MEAFSPGDIRAIGGGRLTDFAYKPAIGASGGILICWDDRKWVGGEISVDSYSISIILEDESPVGDGSVPRCMIHRKTWLSDIFMGLEEFQLALKWEVGEGSKVSFWADVWLGETSLGERFPALFGLAVNKEGPVLQFWRGEIGNGHWVVRFTRPPATEEAVALEELIDALHGSCLNDTGSNKMIWRSMPGAGFSVKSCYQWLGRDKLPMEETARKLREIWSFKFPLKVKAFLWTVYPEKLLTKSRRARWDPATDILCVFCKVEPETVFHLLISCPLVKTIWSWVSKATGLYVGFTSLEGMWEAGRILKR
ncbi:hypothetical protein QJS10_CPB14g01073 [Acorus calamus]|uniref:Reverse transcriptase zinc-binding domain-containing protein n=1 Tax=Acorus calamus TaxID=4465 RepID=A0AAV9DB49_ACOCL|nr:hypothetical protein QJS10_CPB14g01073 [Acorus calamus]